MSQKLRQRKKNARDRIQSVKHGVMEHFRVLKQRRALSRDALGGEEHQVCGAHPAVAAPVRAGDKVHAYSEGEPDIY